MQLKMLEIKRKWSFIDKIKFKTFGFNTIQLSYNHGFTDNVGLSFLKYLHNLLCLSIDNHNKLTDISCIEYCKNLKEFHFNGISKYKILFSNFTSLNKCYIKYHKNILSILQLDSLKHLTLYDFEGKDLLSLKKLTNLKSLVLINSPNLESLNGLKHLSNVEYIDIYDCPYLQDIKDFSEVRRLVKLSLDDYKIFRSADMLSEYEEHVIKVYGKERIDKFFTSVESMKNNMRK